MVPALAAGAVEDQTAAGFETVLAGTNDYRRLNGIDPLVHDPRLSAVAQAWAEQMAADYASSGDMNQAFRHNPNMSSQVPAGWQAVGENIAWNRGYPSPYLTLMDQWRTSPGHSANMLNTRWTHVGIGTYQDAGGSTWGVQVFADYGSPETTPDPGNANVDLDSISYTGTVNCVVLVNEPSHVEFFRECGTRPGNVYTFSDVPPGDYSATLLASGGGALYSGWPVHVVSGPRLVGLAPALGSTAGGTTVTMTGTSLTGATSVTFGGVAGTSLSVTNDGSLTVTTPAHAAGAVNVVITTASGSSPTRTFTFVAPPPTVTGTADGASIPLGSAAGATVTVSPVPSSGTASLEYLNGSVWTPFATPVTLVGGSAHFSWAPPQTFQYRALYGTTYSAPFTITVVAPTVTGTADSASIPGGGSAGATVSVSPVPGSGTARLEYLSGSTWTPFATPVTLVGGSAHFSWAPPQTFQYRAVFGTTYSAPFTITVTPPTVTGAADSASIPGGGSAGATVTVSPNPGSATARLEYLSGSTWTPFATPVTLVGGSAHFSWAPPQTFQYRAVFGSTVSSPFTITVTPPTVAGAADAASIAAGGSAGATVTVDPVPGSGTARLEYLSGSTWTAFATPVTLVGGSAHFSWAPPQTFQYRAVFGSTVSAPFTITVTPPTVTGAADSATIPSGGSGGATVTVSPNPGSGTARLEYLNGSTWTPFASPVTLVAGSAHFSWAPLQTFQYRAVFGSTVSAPFTITVTPPTVTGTADAASIAPGGVAGATVAVSPNPGSATARLEYLNGSTWTPFATPVTLVGGSAHFSWVPPQTFQYRAVFATTISPTFTITVGGTG
jgi:hypothetical protein